MNSFGENLRRLCETRRCHMRELASSLDVSVPYILDIELGRRKPPRQDMLKKIAQFFEIDQSELEYWIAEDRDLVEIDISDRGPVADAALWFLRRRRTLTEKDANAILAILQRGNCHGEMFEDAVQEQQRDRRASSSGYHQSNWDVTKPDAAKCLG